MPKKKRLSPVSKYRIVVENIHPQYTAGDPDPKFVGYWRHFVKAVLSTGTLRRVANADGYVCFDEANRARSELLAA